jgi:putative PIN family toxin of toxin-antitoxin system
VRPLRITLDTNLLVPGLIGAARMPPAATATAALVRALQARVIALVVSDPLLAEVERVLQDPSFAVSVRTARRMVRAVRGIATVVEIPGKLAVLTVDPDDNVILETAVAGKADLLATNNLAHFEEVRSRAEAPLRFRGVDIVSLSRCHERIREDWPEADALLRKVWRWSL